MQKKNNGLKNKGNCKEQQKKQRILLIIAIIAGTARVRLENQFGKAGITFTAR